MLTVAYGYRRVLNLLGGGGAYCLQEHRNDLRSDGAWKRGSGMCLEFLFSMLARASFSKLYEYEQAKNGLV